MGYISLQFGDEIDPDSYFAKFSSTDKHMFQKNALDASWGLMQHFTKIENGLARLVVAGLDLDNPAHWKDLAYKVGKTFTTVQVIEMLEDLVKRKALILNTNNSIPLPSEFSKQELPFFRSCRLAMEYRNELAHNGIVILVRQDSENYYHFSMVGLDNPRRYNSKDIFRPVDIGGRSRFDTKGNQTHLSFSDWVYQISMSLPPYFGSPILSPGNESVDKGDFLQHHREKLEKRFQKDNERRLKKIDKLIQTIGSLPVSDGK